MAPVGLSFGGPSWDQQKKPLFSFCASAAYDKKIFLSAKKPLVKGLGVVLYFFYPVGV